MDRWIDGSFIPLIRNFTELHIQNKKTHSVNYFARWLIWNLFENLLFSAHPMQMELICEKASWCSGLNGDELPHLWNFATRITKWAAALRLLWQVAPRYFWKQKYNRKHFFFLFFCSWAHQLQRFTGIIPFREKKRIWMASSTQNRVSDKQPVIKIR